MDKTSYRDGMSTTSETLPSEHKGFQDDMAMANGEPVSAPMLTMTQIVERWLHDFAEGKIQYTPRLVQWRVVRHPDRAFTWHVILNTGRKARLQQ